MDQLVSNTKLEICITFYTLFIILYILSATYSISNISRTTLQCIFITYVLLKILKISMFKQTILNNNFNQKYLEIKHSIQKFTKNNTLVNTVKTLCIVIRDYFEETLCPNSHLNIPLT